METNYTISAVDWTQALYVFTLVALSLCMALEALCPRRRLQQGPLWRWSNNFSLALLTWYISTALSSLVMIHAARFSTNAELGILPTLGIGPIGSFVVLLLCVQFLVYIVHIAFHKIPILWPLHAIHHSDVEVDISTAYRHHPLEPLVSLPLVVPLILVLGAPASVAVAYKATEILLTLFNHSNVRLPAAMERVLRLFLVTPDFHRLHHCSERRYTNSNYSGMVPWFDYLFGTASSRPYDEQESMELGLEYQREASDSRLDRLLTAPFSKGRRTTNPVPASPDIS